jgi:ketosteroid isomerase-like protein
MATFILKSTRLRNNTTPRPAVPGRVLPCYNFTLELQWKNCMQNQEPIEVVLSFLDRINAHDVGGICSLMTPDHTFIDGLGNKFTGVANLRKGWASYFSWFPDYAISHEEILGNGQIVLLTGSARGTYAAGSKLPKENHWETPAAWKAVVRNGQIAEWHVYADNQPARRIMGESNP